MVSRTQQAKFFYALPALLLAIFLVTFALKSQVAHASYTANNLIDNVVYTNSSSMNQSQIQAFLASKNSYLAGYTSYSGRDNANVPAAQIIAEAGADYGINPQVLLATLQKEQSLITDPAPSASQLNFAMGYGCPDSGSCSHPGFYTQVDYASWQLRYNYEAINGRAWGGHAASEYPCRAATRYYSPGLYAGNNVTFFNESGAAYKAFIIANAGTASLYCYTPHVGPYSETGYSGSYNFVISFEAWFGSTQTTIPYAWSMVSYGAYADSNRTQPFSRGIASITPGSKAYFQIKARNNGNVTWDHSFARLGTNAPHDHISPFADSSWLNAARIEMVETTVAPGDVATFNFSMTAPSTAGSYREYFNVLAEGRAWLNDLGASFPIDVVAKNPATDTAANKIASGQVINSGQNIFSADMHSVLCLQQDGNLVLYSDFTTLWASNSAGGGAGSKLAVQSDGNVVLYSASNAPLWSSGTSGNPGAFLALQQDGNVVLYSASNAPLWSSGTANTPDHTSHVNYAITNSSVLPGQSLSTADRKHQLFMQSDGNVVLYSSGVPIWSANPPSNQAGQLAMQRDGNLVIYDSSGKPLWNTRTGGRGVSQLFLQGDGNLVIYNGAGQATWSSGTSGR